jgi:histone H3/H4
MDKNKKNINILKRNGLVLALNKNGINRASPESLYFLEKYIKETISKITLLAKQEMIIHGRKTLKKLDVVSAISLIEKKDEWNID